MVVARLLRREINTMEQQSYYHCYADGNDVRAFVINDADYRFEFNLFAVCAFHSGVVVLVFTIEDSHPHLLLKGTLSQVLEFKRMVESSTLQHIRASRGSGDGVVLNLQLDIVEDQSYLMNVGTYVIVQATKDGKSVMPYDYLWGTGSMYFRTENHIPIWCFDEMGRYVAPREWGQLSFFEQRAVISTRYSIPKNWLVCNGLILPSNYVDVKGFEGIYKTHNCFRTFLSSGRKREQEILDRMAMDRGIMLEDLEARKICEKLCLEMFGKKTSRWLAADQRLELAKSLRKEFRMSVRQLTVLCRLPASEIEKFAVIRKW